MGGEQSAADDGEPLGSGADPVFEPVSVTLVDALGVRVQCSCFPTCYEDLSRNRRFIIGINEAGERDHGQQGQDLQNNAGGLPTLAEYHCTVGHSGPELHQLDEESQSSVFSTEPSSAGSEGNAAEFEFRL